MELDLKAVTTSLAFERTTAQLCADRGVAVEINGLKLVPDSASAFVEFHLAHTFPVINNYRTALHPRVVANSYRTLRWKVFNLAHLMREYDPANNPRDRILGCVVGVDFPDAPAGGWRTQSERAAAPGIRAVAVMFKNAEQVTEILRTHARGTTPWGSEWTVSMENLSWLENSGFLVRGTKGCAEFAEATPPDLKDQGWTYVPCLSAPQELLGTLNTAADDERDGLASRRVVRRYADQETVLLLGGLEGNVFFNGVGLTPGGAQEAEARVGRMLAGGGLRDFDGVVLPDVFAPLRALLKAAETAGQ